MEILEQPAEVLEVLVEETPTLLLEVEDPWRRRFLACLVKTTPSLQRSLRPRFSVTARWTAGIMETQRRSVKCFTFAQRTALEVSTNSPSSAQTGPSSTSSTSSVTGGSTWTAPWQSPSTPSMMRWQLTERKTLQLLLEETLVVLEDAQEGTEEVVAAMAEVVNKVVAKEVEEDVQDPEGTRTSKGPPLHREGLLHQAAGATMTRWEPGMALPMGGTRGGGGGMQGSSIKRRPTLCLKNFTNIERKTERLFGKDRASVLRSVLVYFR